MSKIILAGVGLVVVTAIAGGIASAYGIEGFWNYFVSITAGSTYLQIVLGN